MLTAALLTFLSQTTLLDLCTVGTDAITGEVSINCSVPVNATRFVSTSSPHHDDVYFRANAPVPLFATTNTENGDWDFADTSGVTEIHGFVETGTGSPGRAGVEIYCNNLDGGYVGNSNSCTKFANGPTSDYIGYVSPAGDPVFIGNSWWMQGTNSQIRAGQNWATPLSLRGAPPSGQAAVYTLGPYGSGDEPLVGGVVDSYGIDSYTITKRGDWQPLGWTSAGSLPSCTKATLAYVQNGDWYKCVVGTGWVKVF